MMPLISLIDFRDFPSPFRRLEDLHVRGVLCLPTQQENQFISVYEQGIMMTVHICIKHTEKKKSIFLLKSHLWLSFIIKSIWAWKQWISINKTFQSYPSLWTEKIFLQNINKYNTCSSLIFQTRALNYVDTYSPHQTCTGCAPCDTSCPSALRARASSRSWWWSVCAACGWSGFLGPPQRCSRRQSKTPGRSPCHRR